MNEVQGGKIAGWQAAIAAGVTPGPEVEAAGATVVFRAPIVLPAGAGSTELLALETRDQGHRFNRE